MPIEIRSAQPSDAHDIAVVHVAAWRDAYRGLIPADQIAARTVERRWRQWTTMLTDPDRFTLVACDDATLKGFARARSTQNELFQSYLEALYVMPDAWRTGIGRKLLCAIGERLRAVGINTMALRALRRGFARRFYEKLGARLVPEGIPRDAGHFDDVVYAFDDLGALVEKH
ncbi:MAG: GNAT family N-acetyltransferase [Candidatus Eremiobacteraeota bacterium]|nr:GNAT family N-acetyltransferase [Candidatus Eremiobacteraeota bacterium]